MTHTEGGSEMTIYTCPRCGWTGSEPGSRDYAAENEWAGADRYEDCCPECGGWELDEAYRCDVCGDVFPADVLREGVCKICRTWCEACRGTGIAPSGPVEGRCGRCHGTGQIREEER